MISPKSASIAEELNDQPAAQNVTVNGLNVVETVIIFAVVCFACCLGILSITWCAKRKLQNDNARINAGMRLNTENLEQISGMNSESEIAERDFQSAVQLAVSQDKPSSFPSGASGEDAEEGETRSENFLPPFSDFSQIENPNRI